MFLGDPKLAYKPYFELKQILEQRNDDGGEFSIKDPIKDVKTVITFKIFLTKLGC